MSRTDFEKLAGTVVDGRYQVREKIAHGGMSVVYLATDMRLDRLVALKFLAPHLAVDPGAVERFEREAKSAAKLAHPNVVQVLDQGVDGEFAYLAMEYVPGSTLRDILVRQGALSPQEALTIIEPILAGLASAHAAGLIHRDIKPENVLLGPKGSIKLADFGLSRAASSATHTQTLVGTVAYISPELVLNKDADSRSDVYAVGIMLYEMLTGSQPFAGEMPIQVAFAHVNRPLPDPLSLAPGLPQDLVELIAQSTEKSADDRPVDAGALLEEVQHLQRTLTPAELQSLPPAARARAGAQNGPLETEQLIAPTAPTTAQPTTLLAQGTEPTRAMDVEALSAQPEMGPEEHRDDDAALSKRELRKQAQLQRKQAKTALYQLEKKRPLPRRFLWVGLAVLLAAIAIFGGWFFGAGPGAQVIVPVTRGASADIANARLRSVGITDVRTSLVFDDDIASGQVTGSDPAQGSTTRKFMPLTLTVSKGPQLFELPNLLGHDQSDAANALSQARMRVGKISSSYSDSVAAGLVISQDPQAGDRVRANSGVDLVISQGPAPIDVPAVVGKSQAEATRILTDAGFTVAVDPNQVYDAKTPAGAVSAQNPAGGQAVPQSKITLTLSRGPKLIQVPDLVGKNVSEARQALEDLGFTVRVERVLGGFFDTVRSVDPSEPELPEGSTITLQVV